MKPLVQKKEKKIMETELGLPSGQWENVQNENTAVANAIAQLTSEQRQAVLVLANIGQNDPSRFGLVESIAADMKLSWLDTWVKTTLTLTAAVKGLRSNQIVEITRQPSIMTDMGFFGKAKDKIHL